MSHKHGKELTMPKDMLGVNEVRGVITDLLEKLGGPNGPEWLREQKRFLRREPCWMPQDAPAFPENKYLLLESVGTVTIPATASPFIAREKFAVDNSRRAKVKIAWLSSNFKDWFFAKTEAPAQETTLRYAKLTRPALDAEIRKEIGAENEETTLAQIFALMQAQPNGESGPLLTNGWVNIFYVQDSNGSLRALGVRWLSDGWHVRADSVEFPDRWFGGYQVFSRNS